MWATGLRGVLQFFTILRTLSPYNPCNAYNAYVLNSLHRFIASLMPYYNVVSNGWKLRTPDSPAQPGKHIYHQCSLSLASKAQPEGTSTTSGQVFTQPGQPSAAWKGYLPLPDSSLRMASPVQTAQSGQPCLAQPCQASRAKPALPAI